MSSRYWHDQFGECDLLRIEGVDWIVKSTSTQRIHRIPPYRRSEFSPIAVLKPSEKSAAGSNADEAEDRIESKKSKSFLWAFLTKLGVNSRTQKEMHRQRERHDDAAAIQGENPNCDEGPQLDAIATHIASNSCDRSRLLRVFESLRNGLSPTNTELRPYAVGMETLLEKSRIFLDEVKRDGGSATVLRGQYGQGKTFGLQLLRELALEAGFAVMSTEVDAFENRLDRPSSIYRSLLSSLTFPGESLRGPLSLIKRTSYELSSRLDSSVVGVSFADAASRLLSSEIECKSLAWILSDPDLISKPNLIALLAGEPGIALGQARKAHITPGEARQWPAFSAGSQGDFACYLISGLGRLTRFLGYSGLIVVLDEMEKWQDLNWSAQSRAGNLLGGLIWSSRATLGSRYCYRNDPDSRWTDNCHHSKALTHSNRSGGFPFTTQRRCSLGLAIAMTPRGESGPEATWRDFGKLSFYDLPRFTSQDFKVYLERLYKDYQSAYALRADLTPSVINKALTAWRQTGDTSTRIAVQTAIEVLDSFRDSFQ